MNKQSLSVIAHLQLIRGQLIRRQPSREKKRSYHVVIQLESSVDKCKMKRVYFEINY